MNLNSMKPLDNLSERVSDYYEDEFSRSMIIWEDSPITYSCVLKSDGEPYILSRRNKIGFDLTPKKESYVRKS